MPARLDLAPLNRRLAGYDIDSSAPRSPRSAFRSRAPKRPKGFFAKDGKMPKVAKLKLTKLPALAHLSDKDYAAHLRQLIEAHEEGLRKQLREEGRLFFLGRKAIVEQSPWESPSTFAPHRQISPRLA